MTNRPSEALRRYLHDYRDAIALRWQRRVLEDPEVAHSAHPPSHALLDGVPTLIDKLARGVYFPSDAPCRGRPAIEDDGDGMPAVLRELSHLRAAIVEAATESGVMLDGRDALLVHASIDESMARAAVQIERTALAALRVGEERLRLALEAADVGTWDYRPATGSLTCDARCSTLFGLHDGDPATYQELLARVHSADRDAIRRSVSAAFRPHSGGTFAAEFRTLGHDGARWVAARGRALFDENGDVARFMGTVRDVTEEHREAAIRARFIDILAHDLRQPLAAILGNATFLQRRVDLPGNVLQIVARIVEPARRASRMVKDLLDFARVRSDQALPVLPRAVDLAELCARAVEELEAARPGRTVELEVSGDAHGHWDPDRIAQLLSNLVTNAIDYSAPQQPVTVGVRDRGAEVELVVHNDGGPIAPEILPVIFEPMRRPESGAPRSRGLGLGLFIARAIVGAHGGTIDVTTGEREGTTFRVVLPRSPAEG